jgi:hypothetical protein
MATRPGPRILLPASARRLAADFPRGGTVQRTKAMCAAGAKLDPPPTRRQEKLVGASKGNTCSGSRRDSCRWIYSLGHDRCMVDQINVAGEGFTGGRKSKALAPALGSMAITHHAFSMNLPVLTAVVISMETKFPRAAGMDRVAAATPSRKALASSSCIRSTGIL